MVLTEDRSGRLDGRIVIHASNVTGAGAVQLVQSLLNEVADAFGDHVAEVWLPSTGPLSTPHPTLSGRSRFYRRRLPNSLSRALECLVSPPLSPAARLLVLGDLPLRFAGRQVLLVHTPHLVASQGVKHSPADAVKYLVARRILAANQDRVTWAVVQSEAMRRRLLALYPKLAGRTVVLQQPPPPWISDAPSRHGRVGSGALNLFFPAFPYPHKNHDLLNRFVKEGLGQSLVSSITLTVDAPPGADSRFNHMGPLKPVDVAAAYGATDALLFPSLDESYGLPLVEAMTVGLPIVCADREYARTLCGETAIYFDPMSTSSLEDALQRLKSRLDAGWWPDWTRQLDPLPRTWRDVAGRLIDLCLDRDLDDREGA